MIACFMNDEFKGWVEKTTEVPSAEGWVGVLDHSFSRPVTTVPVMENGQITGREDRTAYDQRQRAAWSNTSSN